MHLVLVVLLFVYQKWDISNARCSLVNTEKEVFFRTVINDVQSIKTGCDYCCRRPRNAGNPKGQMRPFAAGKKKS